MISKKLTDQLIQNNCLTKLKLNKELTNKLNNKEQLFSKAKNH